MTSIWKRDGDILIPVDGEALAELHAHADQKEIRCTLNGARNPKQHRLFFALCKLVAEQDEFFNNNAEKARHEILRKLGHVDYEIDREGTAHVVVKSIAYSAMTQAEFNDLFQNAINLVCQWLGTAPADVQRHLNEMIADRRYEGHLRR